jgi:AraC-like DNA-binding protein
MNSHRCLFICCLFLLGASAHGQISFVIEDMPRGTPPSDSIYISGSFNDWQIHPEYMLRRRIDGKFAITLAAVDTAFEYKFTRGSWLKAETNEKNDYITNRRYIPGSENEIRVRILNWQDLGGAKPFEVISFYFFAISFLGAITIYFLHQIKNKRKSRILYTSRLLLIISVVCLGRVLLETIPFSWQYPLHVGGAWMVYPAAPIFFLLFFSAISPNEKSVLKHSIIPFLFALFTIGTLLNLPLLQFLGNQLPNATSWADLLFAVTSCLVLLYYISLSIRVLTLLKKKEDLHRTELMFFAALLFGAAIFALSIIGKVVLLLISDQSWILWYNHNVITGTASLLPVFVGYFAFTHDEVFRLTVPLLKKGEDLAALKKILHHAMTEQRVFTNAQLTLNELAEIVQIKPHVLSRVINECYNQNFRDFVNRYRIEAFIELANQGASKRFTFLALAYEVGFNSKSTFNVAFKKITNQTPREYFGLKKDKAVTDNSLDSTIL